MTEEDTETKKHFFRQRMWAAQLKAHSQSMATKDIECGRRVVALVGCVRHLVVGDAIFSFGFTAGSLHPFLWRVLKLTFFNDI